MRKITIIVLFSWNWVIFLWWKIFQLHFYWNLTYFFLQFSHILVKLFSVRTQNWHVAHKYAIIKKFCPISFRFGQNDPLITWSFSEKLAKIVDFLIMAYISGSYVIWIWIRILLPNNNNSVKWVPKKKAFEA